MSGWLAVFARMRRQRGQSALLTFFLRLFALRLETIVTGHEGQCSLMKLTYCVGIFTSSVLLFSRA